MLFKVSRLDLVHLTEALEALAADAARRGERLSRQSVVSISINREWSSVL